MTRATKHGLCVKKIVEIRKIEEEDRKSGRQRDGYERQGWVYQSSSKKYSCKLIFANSR